MALTEKRVATMERAIGPTACDGGLVRESGKHDLELILTDL